MKADLTRSDPKRRGSDDDQTRSDDEDEGVRKHSRKYEGCRVNPFQSEPIVEVIHSPSQVNP